MATTNFTSIPIIDLAKAKDPRIRAEVLEDLKHALTSIGFLYVSNHSISDKVITDLVHTLPEIFTLPQEVKDSAALINSPHFLGYSSAGSETTAGKIDKREQFEFATELVDDWTEAKPLAERLKGPNPVSGGVCVSFPDGDAAANKLLPLVVAQELSKASPCRGSIYRRAYQTERRISTPSSRSSLTPSRNFSTFSL